MGVEQQGQGCEAKEGHRGKKRTAWHRHEGRGESREKAAAKQEKTNARKIAPKSTCVPIERYVHQKGKTRNTGNYARILACRRERPRGKGRRRRGNEENHSF